MKIINSTLRAWIITAFMVLMFSSCVKDYSEFNGPGKTEGDAEVTFTIAVPGNSAATRASDTDISFEEQVKTIEVLTFEKVNGVYELLKISYCDEINNLEGTKKGFTVSLPKIENAQIMVLANCRNHMGSIVLGGANTYTQKDISDLLVMEYDEADTDVGILRDKFMEDGIPFWGMSVPFDIDDNTKMNDPIKLVRMIAKIDIALTTDKAAAAFKLQSVRLYNYNTRGSIMPDPDTWNFTSSIATGTYLPAIPGTVAGPLVYGSDYVEDDKNIINTIYTFEANKGVDTGRENNVCIVVGGEYSDGKTYYYRLDFIKQENSKNVYQPLLRNFHYKLSITDVQGPGYITPQEAFDSAPINIVAELMDWNTGSISDMVFDGQYMLGVSDKSFTLTRETIEEGKNSEVLTVFTDFPTGWKASLYDDLDCTTVLTEDPVTDEPWLRLSSSAGTGDAVSGENTYLIVAANTGTEPREAYIQLTAGRMKYVVKVTQTIYADTKLEILNSQGKPITEIIFSGEPDEVPDAQQFTIVWSPSDYEVVVTGLTTGGQPFELTQISPNIEGTTYLSGTGSKTYTITPDAIGYSSDDFFEKAARIDLSMMTPEGIMSQTLHIRQTNFDLMSGTDKDVFLLDGSMQSFKVRSNFTWRVEMVPGTDTHGRVTEFRPQYGSNNTAEGTTVNFKLKDLISNFSVDEDLQSSFKVQFYKFTEGEGWEKWQEEKVVECMSAKYMDPANCYMIDSDNPVPIFIPIYEQVGRAMDKRIAGTSAAGDAILSQDWLTPAAGRRFETGVLWSNRPFDGAEVIVKDLILVGDNTEQITSGSGAGIVVVPGSLQGSAVVVLYEDANGDLKYIPGDGDVVKWSWHIWNTPYAPDLNGVNPPADQLSGGPMLSNTKGGIIYGHHNGAQVSNLFMDRNLGASDITLNPDNTVVYANNEERLNTYGLMYQWGRKDPIIGSGTIDRLNVSATVYTDPDFTTVTFANRTVTAPNNLINSIQNPLDFYRGQGDWYSNVSDISHTNPGLWGGGDGFEMYEKTVHDPCPPGWRVPVTNFVDFPTPVSYAREPWALIIDGNHLPSQLTYFTNTPFRQGYYFNEDTYHLGWYPASGYRAGNTTGGNIFGDMGTYGYYWGAGSYRGKTGGTFGFYVNSLNRASNNYKSNGMPVRCVADLYGK